MATHLIGKNPSRGDIVAIAKTTRDAHNLILLNQGWVLQHLIDMYSISLPTGKLKRVLGFVITISARGT
jgi:hypothetical protein